MWQAAYLAVPVNHVEHNALCLLKLSLQSSHTDTPNRCNAILKEILGARVCPAPSKSFCLVAASDYNVPAVPKAAFMQCRAPGKS
jgi:hypothetical protein